MKLPNKPSKQKPDTSKDSKCHHYVPKLILRNFTDQSGNLHCFNKKVGTTYPARPRRVFAQNRLNTYRPEYGPTSTHAETLFAELESEAIDIVRKIRRKVRSGCSISLTDQEHSTWAKFLIAQIARHPGRLSRLREEDIIPKLTRHFESKYYPVDPLIKAYVHSSIVKERMMHNAFIETALPDKIFPGIAPIFASRNIVALVTNKKTESFVIGDTGVIRYPTVVPDLRHPNTRLLYPISWDIVLAWGFPRNSKDVIFIPCDEIPTANELILSQSDIIAGCDPGLIESLSRKTNHV